MGYFDMDYLEHHGILGQKWGVRRFQKKDGTRTPAGKERENNKKISTDDDQVNKLASKTRTFIGDADATFKFLTEDTINNLTNYGHSETSKNYNAKEVMDTYRKAFGDDKDAQRQALKWQYAAEATRFMEEESADPGSSQVFKSSKNNPDFDRFSRNQDIATANDWGTGRSDEWKGYIEENVGHKIESLSSKEKASALKETGLHYDDEDISTIERLNKDYLEHHQILGAKHGVRNGPPYPLGSGDHSAAEKRAAKAAGVKVGKDSGKGSIENVKKDKKGGSGSNQHAKKPPLTEEEKRLKAEEARLKGDSKNINKYMDKLTTDELRDAQTRAQIKKSLAEEKQSKADKEKKEAMLSGDKEKVMANADKMTYSELQEAMNKVDLMQKLNYKPPEPTTMDKIDAAMKKVDKARDWMDKGLKAYDALAAINNTFNKDHKWPRAEFNNNKGDDKKKEDKIESIAKKIVGDAKEAKQQNDQKAQQKQSDRTENKRIELEDKTLKFEQQKYNDQRNDAKKAEKAAKEEAKEAKKAAKAEAKEAKESTKEITFNNYKVDNDETLSRKVDDHLTSNENEMLNKISSGDFNWDDYDIRKHTPS